MKKVSCYLIKLSFTTVFILTGSAFLNAQDATSSNMAAAQSTVMSDTAFIAKNISDNMMEIRLSRLGRQKATDPQIKRMAQQMVTDHTQILNDLKRVARQKNMAAVPDYQSNAGMSDMGAGTAGTPANATTGAGTPGTDLNAATSPAGGANTGGGGAATTRGATATGDRASGTGTNTGGTETGTGTNAVGTGASGTGTNPGGTGASGTGTNTGGADASGTGTNTGGAGASGARTDAPGVSAANAAGINHDMQSTGMNGTQDMKAAMDALQNATGREFNTLFLTQMLAMHEAKLAELQTASARITDPILKSAVAKALPKIRMHRDMLARINRGIDRNR